MATEHASYAVWPTLLLAILLAALSAISVFVAITTTSGCAADPVIPINPTKTNPCGVGAYYECPDHGCCLAYTEECTPYHMCRYVGESSTFGAGRDAGPRERPEVSPEQAQKAAPR